MKTLGRLLAATAVIAAWGAEARAEVIGEAGPASFEIVHRTTIAAPRAEVFAAFTDIGKWWNPEHTYTLDSANLSLDPRPGGWFLETLPDGGFVRHLEIVYWQPPETVRLTGGLGPLQEYAVAGAMTVQFAKDTNGAVVTVTYRVSGGVPGGLADWAPAVDGVVSEQFERLKAYVERRSAGR